MTTQGNILNLKRAEDHPAFNKAVDIKTGYKTRSMLVIPIRGADTLGIDGVKEGKSIITASAPIGVVQCINKLGSREDGEAPYFTNEDEENLGEFCRQTAPILQKVKLRKRVS